MAKSLKCNDCGVLLENVKQAQTHGEVGLKSALTCVYSVLVLQTDSYRPQKSAAAEGCGGHGNAPRLMQQEVQKCSF
eukprot:103241-Pelagomonas_calceolata.AAC.4